MPVMIAEENYAASGDFMAYGGNPELSVNIAQTLIERFNGTMAGKDVELELIKADGETLKVTSGDLKGADQSEEPGHVFVLFEHLNIDKRIVAGTALVSVAALCGLVAVLNKKKHPGLKP